MAKKFERKSTNITVSEFYENYQDDKYKFDTPYQRNSSIWSDDKKSFLIDSILKNYPMPAVFLRPLVNSEGRTTYDVVDGKQRLQTIASFVEGKVPLADSFAEDEFIDDHDREIAEKIAGLTFTEIRECSDYNSYIRQFWNYAINVEYLYEDRGELIASVFDRLNRNGEPLTKQELRNAKFSQSAFWKLLKDESSTGYFSDKLGRLDKNRMEDLEFISELYFMVLEKHPLDSNPDKIDSLYDKYANDIESLNNAQVEFSRITTLLGNLNISYNNKRIYGTTHLYTIFSLGWHMVTKHIDISDIDRQVNAFYREYFSRSHDHDIESYRRGCSSRTRSESRRLERLNALLSYCGLSM